METEQRPNFTECADTLVDLIGASLDAPADGNALAHEAHYSRFYFQRMFRAHIGETPADCRRRLLLERAAYHLRRTQQPTTEIAFDAGYESLEGFSRAFRKAYGVSPSHYRRLEPLSWYLASPNDIHYEPSAGGPVRLARQKGEIMDLNDRLIEHDGWLTCRLLERAATLTDGQLDAPIEQPAHHLRFEGLERTLGELLDRLVFTKFAFDRHSRWREADQSAAVAATVPQRPRCRPADFDLHFSSVVATLTQNFRASH